MLKSLRKCKGRADVREDGKLKDLEFELGYFHEWGIDCVATEYGPAHFPVAIVELPDGRIVTPSANYIVFLDTK